MSSLRIGPFCFANRLVVAPMAGVTDRPFRVLCRRFGAAHAVSEMVASRPELWQTPKSMRRLDHAGEPGIVTVQIAGAEPALLAEAARHNVERGARIIDINMGCPKKKVCKLDAGSALLRDESLVARLLAAVVRAVDVPVTVKIRTGWAPDRRNAVTVARIAQDCGIAAITVHGRTRACGFEPGTVEYDTIRAVRRAVSIPVIANGDIDSPQKAKAVLDATAADGVMIGRAAQGRPWIFRDTLHFLDTGTVAPPPTLSEVRALLAEHLDEHYRLYGEEAGVRSARKHIGWYFADVAVLGELLPALWRIDTASAQLAAVLACIDRLGERCERLPVAPYPPSAPVSRLLKNVARMARCEAPGAQRSRHIKQIGEGASTAQRSDSPAQPFIQRFPRRRPLTPTTHPATPFDAHCVRPPVCAAQLLVH